MGLHKVMTLGLLSPHGKLPLGAFNLVRDIRRMQGKEKSLNERVHAQEDNEGHQGSGESKL